MASSKDIYESDIYRANIYASGIWRGIGIDAVGVSAVIEDLVRYGYEQQEVTDFGFTATEVIYYG